MTVTLYHLCASMRACVRVFVEAASLIFVLRVCSFKFKRLHSFHIEAEPEKHTIHI